jgi:hypothetical protein
MCDSWSRIVDLVQVGIVAMEKENTVPYSRAEDIDVQARLSLHVYLST